METNTMTMLASKEFVPEVSNVLTCLQWLPVKDSITATAQLGIPTLASVHLHLPPTLHLVPLDPYALAIF